jgi:Zn-dependent M28 family amino/carboxypeptidase
MADLPLRRTVQFVAFNDEEQGLIGSRDLARRLAAQQSAPGGPKVVGVINLDMVAFDADGDRRIQLQTNREAGSIRLADRLKHAAADFNLNVHLVKVTDLEESSDYASFWRVGMPAINIGDEYFLCDDDVENPAEKDVTPPRGDFTPCYHKPCDRLDDPAFRVDLVAEVARLLVAGVADLAETAGP